MGYLLSKSSSIFIAGTSDKQKLPVYTIVFALILFFTMSTPDCLSSHQPTTQFTFFAWAHISSFEM